MDIANIWSKFWSKFWFGLVHNAFEKKTIQLQYENEEWSIVPRRGQSLPQWMFWLPATTMERCIRALLLTQKQKILASRAEEDKRRVVAWSEDEPSKVVYRVAFEGDDKSQVVIKLYDKTPWSFEAQWAEVFSDHIEKLANAEGVGVDVSFESVDLLERYPGIASDGKLHGMASIFMLVFAKAPEGDLTHFVESLLDEEFTVCGKTLEGSF